VTRIKFCGCTSWSDVELAYESGVDAVGMLFAPSERRIEWKAAEEIAQRIPQDISPVGVFVDPTLDEIDRARELFPEMIVQLSGNEAPEFVHSIRGTIIKALHVGDEPAGEMEEVFNTFAPSLMLLDTKVAGKHGGTGVTFDWSRIARLARWRPLMVAGGLTPANVADCVRRVRPFGVDVRSGIETDGRKDPAKMRAFVKAVRESDRS
jgi:phosphoribosylanthranilate isomerase